MLGKDRVERVRGVRLRRLLRIRAGAEVVPKVLELRELRASTALGWPRGRKLAHGLQRPNVWANSEKDAKLTQKLGQLQPL